MTRLREIKQLGRMKAEPRRWFTSHEMDLTVWLAPSGKPAAFQFCYGKGNHEKALTWRPESGFGHHAVDDGEHAGGGGKMTPILGQAEPIDVPMVVSLFATAGVALPEGVRRFVSEKLAELQTGSCIPAP